MTIQERVAEKINGCGAAVVSTIVDKLAEVEINRRIDLITKALSKQEALEKEFKKSHKPDVPELYGADNTITTPAQYSKNKLETIRKDKEKLSNLVKNMEVCLEKNLTEDYNKLQETLNKLNNVGGDKKEGTGESKSES